MATVINLKNPIEVREAGLKALNTALGYEGTRAFIDQYEGSGDFTAEKYNRPVQSFEDITMMIRKASEESNRNKS